MINLLALVLLFPVGLRVPEDFDDQMKAGVQPVLDPEKFSDLDIDPSAWDGERRPRGAP